MQLEIDPLLQPGLSDLFEITRPRPKRQPVERVDDFLIAGNGSERRGRGIALLSVEWHSDRNRHRKREDSSHTSMLNAVGGNELWKLRKSLKTLTEVKVFWQKWAGAGGGANRGCPYQMVSMGYLRTAGSAVING